MVPKIVVIFLIKVETVRPQSGKVGTTQLCTTGRMVKGLISKEYLFEIQIITEFEQDGIFFVVCQQQVEPRIHRQLGGLDASDREIIGDD